MLSLKMKFNQAKQACQDEGSVLAMPRTVEDISDIKEFDCEYVPSGQKFRTNFKVIEHKSFGDWVTLTSDQSLKVSR